MAIPSELTSFNSEDDFTDRFLIPLLRRLGFSLVANYHGKSEFGKDVIFGEIDRIGHVEYHGMQVKHVPSIGLGDAEELVQDAKQAFNNQFLHPQTGSQERVSKFFAVNSGSISDQARQQFFNSLQPAYGANVRLLDGKALLSLDRHAAANSGAFVTERLTGLLLELRFNRLSSARNRTSIDRFINGGNPPMARLRLVAIESVISQPILMTEEFVCALHSYWGVSGVINRALDHAASPAGDDKFRKIKAKVAQELITALEMAEQTIERTVTAHLATMGSTISDSLNVSQINFE